MSDFDPTEHLGLDNPHPRRRDLREASTSRSRRAARKRSAANRRTRVAMKRSMAASSPRGSKPRTSVGKRIWRGLVSVVALALAAAFALATVGSPLLFSSSSAASVSATKGTTKSTIVGQALTAGGSQQAEINRGSFQALNSTEMYALKAGGLGYVVNNSGIIRWPFNVAVPINSPFGPRVAPCAGCSTFHNGTDFGTGADAPVYAVAAGVVTQSELAGSFGQYVEIDHDVRGYKFTSIYAHLTANSETVHVGDTVKEGELLGLTGSTGESTGAHLDFEIDIDGTPVDSFIWLKKHTAH